MQIHVIPPVAWLISLVMAGGLVGPGPAAAQGSPTDPRQAPPRPPVPVSEDYDEGPSPRGVVLRVGGVAEGAAWGGMYRLLFTPDGKHFVTRDYSQTIRVWAAASGKLRHELTGHEDYVKALEISPDGNFLISAADDPQDDVRVWDVRTGQLVRRVAGGGKLVQFLPDLTTLVVVSDEKIAHYEMATGALLYEFPEVRIPLALSPDGKQLVAMRKLDDDKLVLFDTATGKQKLELSGLTANPAAVRFSPDGKLLAVAGRREELARVWDIAEQKVVLTLKGDDAAESPPYVQDVAFSRDGRFLATASWDGRVRIFEREGGRRIASLQGHRDKAVAVEFSPDGRLLASGSAGRSDATAVLWSVIDGIVPEDIAAEKIDGPVLEAAWTQLGLEDPAPAYGAIGPLLADGGKTMQFVQAKLGKDLKAAPLEEIERLIAELDADDFGVRERATAELMRLRLPAEALLRKKLAETDQPEVKFRIHKILTAEPPPSKLTAEQWRQLRRLVYILETLARSESGSAKRAREFLSQMSTGHGDVQVMREAAAAAERLGP